ncbi:MAG: hypothetical protein IKU40_04520 [Clostridia bacterium]|nr:hypothetical protein [Clostridia bacterium]
MLWIEYGNRENGYGFYGSSKDFPIEKYRKAITDICSSMTVFQKTGSAEPALRYGPLGGGDYILSVIYRNMIRAEDHRASVSAVHFILNTREADMMFRDNLFRRRAKGFREYSRLIVENKLPADREDQKKIFEKFMADGDSTFSAVKNIGEELQIFLYAGALCAQQEPPMKNQIFISGMNPECCLDWLFSHLPASLRKTVSFHTGVENAADSQNIGLNFSNADRFENIRAGGFGGGMPAKKSYYCSEQKAVWNADDEIRRKAELLSRKNEEDDQEIMKLIGEIGSWETYHEILETLWLPDEAESIVRFLDVMGDERVLHCLQHKIFSPEWEAGTVKYCLKNIRKFPQTSEFLRQRKRNQRKQQKMSADCSGSEDFDGSDERRERLKEMIAADQKTASDERRKSAGKTVSGIFTVLAGICVLTLIVPCTFVFLMKQAILGYYDGIGQILNFQLDLDVFLYVLHILLTAVVSFCAGDCFRQLTGMFKKRKNKPEFLCGRQNDQRG